MPEPTYATQGAIPWRALGDVELRHGYTLADANRLSIVAIRNAWGHQRFDSDERLEIAWFAIVEHIYAAEDHPEVNHLLRAATRALHGQDHQERRFRGIRDTSGGIRTRF